MRTVYHRLDGGIWTTHRTCFVSRWLLDGIKRTLQRIVHEQPIVHGRSDTRQHLESLGRLQNANQPRHRAQNTIVAATLTALGGIDARIQAPIARSTIDAASIHRQLALGTHGTSRHQNTAGQNTCVVDQVSRPGIIAGIHHKVMGRHQIQGIVRSERFRDGSALHSGIECLQGPAGRFRLVHSDGRIGMDDLPVQIGPIDLIKVHYGDGPNARCCQVGQHGGADATGTNYQYRRRQQLALSCHAKSIR
mmetsp:Transcript_3873/g.10963  ORF Transcript_3873/g.10963 Transcript_3873/m.10963 type:complete len:249 (-) Transcript_3873:308-1054(-)